MTTELQQLNFMLGMIFNGVKENDKDSTRANLEELNNWLIEKNKLAE